MTMKNVFERALDSLDLEGVVSRIVADPHGPKWSLEKTRSVEVWYRRFLFLAFKYPDQLLVPTKDIDVFWHAHILDTKRYANDCTRLFGDYLHHYPDDESENVTKDVSRLETEELFLRHFRENPFGQSQLSGKSLTSAAPCNRCSGGGGGRCGRLASTGV